MERLASGLGFESFKLLQTEIRANYSGPRDLERGLLLIGAKCCMLFCAVCAYVPCLYLVWQQGWRVQRFQAPRCSVELTKMRKRPGVGMGLGVMFSSQSERLEISLGLK